MGNDNLDSEEGSDFPEELISINNLLDEVLEFIRKMREKTTTNYYGNNKFFPVIDYENYGNNFLKKLEENISIAKRDVSKLITYSSELKKDIDRYRIRNEVVAICEAIKILKENLESAYNSAISLNFSRKYNEELDTLINEWWKQKQNLFLNMPCFSITGIDFNKSGEYYGSLWKREFIDFIFIFNLEKFMHSGKKINSDIKRILKRDIKEFLIYTLKQVNNHCITEPYNGENTNYKYIEYIDIDELTPYISSAEGGLYVKLYIKIKINQLANIS